MDATTYTCAECGGSVTVIDGEFNRPCGHDEAGIIADMKAVTYGVGGMES